MAYPISSSPWNSVTAASPAYSGVFIPTLWSGKLIEKFYDATVLAAIANTDYAGEIKNQGDKITIRTKPTLTVNDYEATQSISFERPSSNVVELLIDKGKYFAAVVDDVMETQSDLNLMGMWADDASEQMKISIDSAVLRTIAAGVASDNAGATAGRISGNIDLGVTTAPLDLVARGATTGEVEVIDAILRYGQVLDEQNIPEQGRWVVVPSWMAAMIKRSELRDASLTGDGTTMLRNGRLGMIDRFTVYVSNLLPTGVADSLAAGEFNVFAGHSHGLTFASQLTKMETLRAETTFGTIMRGLQVYGSKVTDGTAIVSSIVKAA
ncbi:MAG: hypothetical protein R3260_03495 [Pseudomonas sp.]|nr:hypothetical protein [Pseudomonas sp.]